MKELKLWLALCLALAAASAAAQAGYSVQDWVFLPPRFYVGDRVELRLRLLVEKEMAVGEAQELPAAPWLEVREVQVQDRRQPGRPGEVTVRLFFTPYRPGTMTLPPIVLGELALQGLKINTYSALEAEEDPQLRGLRGQLLLPYTALRLAGIALAALGLPLAAAALGWWLLRLLARAGKARRRRLPALRARRALGRLERLLADPDASSFYFQLSRLLKGYLSGRLEVPALSFTTAELSGRLQGSPLPEPVRSRLLELLQEADLVKFAGRACGRQERLASLGAAREVVDHIEGSLKRAAS